MRVRAGRGVAIRDAAAVGVALTLPRGGTQRNAAPWAAFGFYLAEALGYFVWSTIQSTAAFICSSVRAGLPPLGGMKLPSGPW